MTFRSIIAEHLDWISGAAQVAASGVMKKFAQAYNVSEGLSSYKTAQGF